MIFLGLFIFFVCMFAYLRHKSTAAEEAAAEKLLGTARTKQTTHAARTSAGFPILPYLLPIFQVGGIDDNPELKKYEETLQSLAGQKILNLGGKTNTDLKLEYGVANLETLCACDENYTTLCRTIYEYAECLKKLGHDAGGSPGSRVRHQLRIRSQWELPDARRLLSKRQGFRRT